MLARRQTVQTLAALSLTEKASSLAQLACLACEPVVNVSGELELHLTTPIDVEPWSHQSKDVRTRIRGAVQREMRNRQRYVPHDGPICLSVVAVVPRRAHRKDVDNLVKDLLDELQGVLFVNDEQIQCLTTRRVEYAGERGYYLVRAIAVHGFDGDVVAPDDATRPLFL